MIDILNEWNYPWSTDYGYLYFSLAQMPRAENLTDKSLARLFFFMYHFPKYVNYIPWGSPQEDGLAQILRSPLRTDLSKLLTKKVIVDKGALVSTFTKRLKDLNDPFRDERFFLILPKNETDHELFLGLMRVEWLPLQRTFMESFLDGKMVMKNF